MSTVFSFSTRDVNVGHTFDAHADSSLNVSHCHSEYEILFVREGHGRFLVEGAEFPMEPMTLILVPPLRYHCVEVSDEHSYDRMVIRFRPWLLPQKYTELLEKLVEESDGIYLPGGCIPEAALAVFDRISTVCGVPDKQKNAMMTLLISEILLLLSTAEYKKFSECDDDLGARALRYLNLHLYENITLDRVARHFFVSKYYLCRAFKKRNGISVHGYITKKRIIRAKQLIEAGETATGAAYRVGFGDYSAFYRSYVKIVGVSPVARGNKRNWEDETE